MGRAKLPAEIPNLGLVPDTWIAQRYGCTPEAVRQRRVRAGRPRPGEVARAARVEDVQRLAAGATTLREAMRRAHCGTTMAQLAGFTAGRRGRPAHATPKPGSAAEAVVGALRGAPTGLRACEIARWANIAPARVGNVLQRGLEHGWVRCEGAGRRRRWFYVALPSPDHGRRLRPADDDLGAVVAPHDPAAVAAAEHRDRAADGEAVPESARDVSEQSDGSDGAWETRGGECEVHGGSTLRDGADDTKESR